MTHLKGPILQEESPGDSCHGTLLRASVAPLLHLAFRQSLVPYLEVLFHVLKCFCLLPETVSPGRSHLLYLLYPPSLREPILLQYLCSLRHLLFLPLLPLGLGQGVTLHVPDLFYNGVAETHSPTLTFPSIFLLPTPAFIVT